MILVNHLFILYLETSMHDDVLYLSLAKRLGVSRKKCLVLYYRYYNETHKIGEWKTTVRLKLLCAIIQ